VASGEALDAAAAAAALVGRRRPQGAAAAAGGGAVGERGLRAPGAGRAGVALEPHGLPLLPRPRRRPARLPRLRRRAHPLPHRHAPALLISSLPRLLLESGRVFSTGLNDFGQLGIGSSVTHTLEPVEVSGFHERVVEISAGNHHSCAITGKTK